MMSIICGNARRGSRVCARRGGAATAWSSVWAERVDRPKAIARHSEVERRRHARPCGGAIARARGLLGQRGSRFGNLTFAQLPPLSIFAHEVLSHCHGDGVAPTAAQDVEAAFAGTRRGRAPGQRGQNWRWQGQSWRGGCGDARGHGGPWRRQRRIGRAWNGWGCWQRGRCRRWGGLRRSGPRGRVTTRAWRRWAFRSRRGLW